MALNKIPALLMTLLAFAAGVDEVVLNEKTPEGRYRYRSGRNKYLAVGALVCFFSLFSGVGMYHLLIGLPGASVVDATLGGLVWALFIFWLEKVILGAIPEDAGPLARFWGGVWRFTLGAFSALTLAGPFFIQINRTELDVHILDMEKARKEASLESSRKATGLPGLETERSGLDDNIRRVNESLSSEPHDLAALHRQAEECWTGFRNREANLRPRLQRLTEERKLAVEAKADEKAIELSESIGQIALQLRNGRTVCARETKDYEQRRREWKDGLNREQQRLSTENTRLQEKITKAASQATQMHEEHANRIHLAARGFVADFNAAYDLVQHDAAMRTSAIWLFSWFLLIEVSAIIAKLARKTDLDSRMRVDELEQMALAERDGALVKIVAEAELMLAEAEKEATKAWLAEDGLGQLQETLRINALANTQQQAIEYAIEMLASACRLLDEAEALARRGASLDFVTRARLLRLLERSADIACIATEKALAAMASEGRTA